MEWNSVEVPIERFTSDGHTIKLEGQGHKSEYTGKGRDGNLVVTVRVYDEVDRWREGNDIHSRHVISLAEALEGCSIAVKTVHDMQDI